MSHFARRELAALAVLATILAITAAWWALALWPMPGDAPGWLLRTRDVCFGTANNGLPASAGWMVLIGQPLYMLATLWLISGQSLSSGLRALRRFPVGRAVLIASIAAIVVGLGAAGVRVAQARDVLPERSTARTATAADMPRLNRAAPALDLVDQLGGRVTLGDLRGRPVFLTFAFAHCETVCPLIVHDVLQARAALPDLKAAVVVVTLDPWRDPPARLPSMAAAWDLGERDHVLSGTIADVERALDRWDVARGRDARTGEIVHVPATYLIDRDGRIAYALTGDIGVATLTALARGL